MVEHLSETMFLHCLSCVAIQMLYFSFFLEFFSFSVWCLSVWTI